MRLTTTLARVVAAGLFAATAAVGLPAVGNAAPAGAEGLKESAQTSDWGGYGDPTSCSDAYTVASTPIKDSGGRTTGVLELRWSWACYGQWARLTSYGTAKHLGVSLREVSHSSNAAGADDYNVSRNWNRYIRLIDGSSSRVCAYGDIYAYSGVHSGGAICA